MVQPAPLHLELRRATRSRHEALESALDLLDPGLTLERYVWVLQRFEPIYRHLEACIDDVLGHRPDDAAELAWPRRRKLPLLLTDLQDLRAEHHPVAPQLPSLQSYGDVLGAMYVTEGATLGAKTIRPHVDRVLGLGGRATTFFTNYGDEGPSLWASFRRRLDAASGDRIVRSDAQRTAIAVFDSFLEQCSVDRRSTHE